MHPAWLLALPLATLPVGCGTPPPCNVKPAEIEAARLAAVAASAESGDERAAAEAAELAELAELEQAIAALKLQIRTAADSTAERAALEHRLDELKRGSGR